MATRLTRGERQAQTRAALIEAAREGFLADGYDGASLAQIADAAGCTTGAVYANFAGKDELFLAVLDTRSAGSVQAQAAILTAEIALEEALRRTARFLIDEFAHDERWIALMTEYWARVARNAEFRAAAAQRQERIIAATASLIEKLVERHGMRTRIPAREIARGGGALSRGVRLERALGLDDGAGPEAFEEMFVALASGLLEPAHSNRKEKVR